ncbi:TetR/AcrR family transcriptional regulator [Paenalcaligenes sp.]|uniref:TetR/AcrR family transcriptional regulator n=1 Tax=Paenalcaligenes sp. TaxID=1966342 RepID=UPI0026122F86|nr:TetR/AcrR family transcriptional regulator [Paenalcaligenes sp.]
MLKEVVKKNDDSMRQDTLATREALLDAAEYLFTQQGHDATSLRQITTRAQANLAAVNYHFGNKEGLIEAVFKRRLEILNQERLLRLEALEQQAKQTGEPIKASAIVDAFFGTLIRIANEGNDAAWSLLERSMMDPAQFTRTLFAEECAEVLERYKQALFKALPHVPHEEIVWRFQFMLGATAFALSGTHALREVLGLEQSAAEDPTQAAERLLPRLMAFLLGGLRAPL